jgi:transposase
MEKRVRRVFDLGLKLDLVHKIELGKLTVLEISKIYGVSARAVYKWLHKYSELYRNQTRVIVEGKSVSKKNQEMSARIKELERALGQKQMRVDYLEKLLEVASERLGEDIEKKIKRLP